SACSGGPAIPAHILSDDLQISLICQTVVVEVIPASMPSILGTEMLPAPDICLVYDQVEIAVSWPVDAAGQQGVKFRPERVVILLYFGRPMRPGWQKVTRPVVQLGQPYVLVHGVKFVT